MLISISQALGQRLLCCPKRGTYVPPFFEVWEGRTYGPCNPLKVLGFHPKPHKPFEKGLSENFTCLHPTQARAFGLAALSQLRRL